MASFVRLFTVSLLCGLAALGQTPAWLHVAGCDHEGELQQRVLSDSASPSDHHHGCCHHAADEAESAAEPAASSQQGHSDGSHDSDSCSICQSLVMPSGIVWKLDSLSIVRADFEVVKISPVVAPESASLSIPQPRGPPALLA